MNITSSRRVGLAFCVVTPVIVLAVIRSSVPGMGPLSARAATPAREPAPSTAAADVSVAPDVLAELERLDRQPLGPSPFSAPGRVRVVEPSTPDAPAPRQTPKFEPVFQLTSVIGGQRPMAIIDGTVRRTGDDIGQGWSVQSIDATSKSVTLAGPNSGSMTLSLRQ